MGEVKEGNLINRCSVRNRAIVIYAINGCTRIVIIDGMRCAL